MNLTVKTLKGEKFAIEVEESSTIAQVKTVIETTKSEFPAVSMKLIHSGKVLKDTETIAACNIKPDSFLVVMITKAKKVAAAAPAPTPATPAPASEPKTPAAPERPAATEAATNAETPAPVTASSTTAATTSPAAAPAADEFPAETISNLTAMGFPDAEVRACLRASQGNPDVAVEYLMNGIPSFAQQIAASGGSGATSSAPAPATNAAAPLQQLRDHPQINQLRQLVQSNPDTLQAVLSQIGQQQPELLQEINANQQLFLQIMNEPVQEEAPAPAAPAPSAGSTAGARPGPGGMLEAMQNPAQMAQMLQGMNPEQLATMSQMLGVSPEQLQGMVQMMSGMPQEELQEYMNMAMQGGGGGGGPRMGGGVPPGAQVLRLSEEEMAAVDRLADMGFDRTEAAQAYIACDKNEALAANLLMDGGFGFGGGDDGNNMGGNGGNNAGNDDDMYD